MPPVIAWFGGDLVSRHQGVLGGALHLEFGHVLGLLFEDEVLGDRLAGEHAQTR